MNMKMSGCLYSFKLEGCPEVANIGEGGRPLSSTFPRPPPPDAGYPCKLVI
jgi:hypothetical protein